MGLLDAIDRVLGTRIGLLVNDPRTAINALESDARAFNQASLLATQAERNAARGFPVSPEQLAAKQYIDRKNEDLAMGFAGTTNPIKGTWYKGMYPYDYTKEIRTAIPNIPQWKQEVIDPGPLIDPSNIARKTPFPSFSSLPDLEGIKGFFAKSPKVASDFAPAENGAVYPVNISAEKVFTIDAKGKRAGELQFGEKSTKFRNAVNSGKYDAIVIKNTSDEGDIAIALKNAKIKSIFEK